MDNVTEKRWLNYYRRGGNKDHHKEHRLSKESIGQPMKLEKNGRFSNIFDTNDALSSGPGPSMVMKCIIVHPDDSGYGLTVSGDKPVYVQSVKEGGAAARAGVVEGDRVLKVNGDPVKNMNHTEVVKLIKAEKAYVALTLLGDPLKTSESISDVSGLPRQPQSVESAQSGTKHSHTFYDEKVETIKKMLEQEKAEVERIKQEYVKNPDPKILKQLGVAEKLKQDLEKQLWKAESKKERHEQEMTSSAIDLDVTGSSDTLATEGSITDESNVEATGSDRGTPTAARLKRAPVQLDLEGQDAAMVVTNENNHTMDRANSAMTANAFADMPGVGNKWGNQLSQNKEIMLFEDDMDIMAKCVSEPGPFDDFEALRQRPAYLAVFLNYIIESKDPANFLLYMAVDSYKQLSSSKDMVKFGEIIYKTYLAADAAFKIPLDDGIARSIQSVLTTKNPAEETLRGVFDPAVQVALKEVRNQLSQFQIKREQGVGNMYGGEKLRKALNMGMQSDSKLVEDIVAPTLNKLQHMTSADDIDQTRINIKLDSVQGFLSQYGTKRAKKSSYMFKLRSKPTPLMKAGRMSGSVDSIIDETKEKRLSGIGNIFGVKKNEKTKSKSDKPKPHERGGSKRNKTNRRHTIRDNPPVFPVGFLKSTRVSTSVSADQLSLMATSAGETSDHGKRPEMAYLEPVSGRPKSVPFDSSLRTIETHSVTIHPAPQLHETPVFDFNPRLGLVPPGEDMDDGPENDLLSANKNLTRAGSFRRPGEPRNGPHKSHSDPDKNKVDEAVAQHNAAHVDQSESHSPHSSTGSSNLPDYSMPSFNQDEEIDIDVTEHQLPRSVTKGLDKKELKRQQFINELISTEQHHVRNLKILEKLFYEPLLSYGFLTRDELNQAFPNLKEILQLHRELNRMLQEIKETDGHVVKYIGDLLLSRFDGESGNTFRNECATYCGNQFTVLSLINEKSKKEPKFNDFLEEAQRNPYCRKLHLKDFIPMETQRLSKYPLLLDNIIKHTKKKHEAEIKKVRTAYNRSREILTFVNQTVKEAEDKQKIIEIQKNLDREPIMKLKHDDKTSATLHEYKNIDLTERTIIHQGSLQWRVGLADKRKLIAVHCILYDDVLVLLQKQDDRYVLCCHGSHSTGGLQEPFISMQRAHVSTVAYDKHAFFVVSYVPAQMCEFVASSASAVKEWMRIIGNTVKTEMATPMIANRRKAVSIPVSRDENEAVEDVEEDKAKEYLSAGNLIGRAEGNEPELIPVQYDQVQFDPSSFSAAMPGYNDPSMLQSRILAMQQEVTNALAAKHRLLAELSNLDDGDLEEMLDMCAADDEPDPVTLVRHAVLCADQLAGIINSSTNVDNTFVRRRQTPVSEDNHQFSVSSYPLPSSDRNEEVSSPEKWASIVPHPSHSVHEKSPSIIRGSSGTLNSVSSLPLSESAPVLSPHFDNDAKDFSISSSGKQSDPQFDPSHSPIPQLNTSPMHRVAESMSLSLEAQQSRIPSDPTSSDTTSRPSSMVDLLVPGTDVPIDKMMSTVLLLQTQLTRLMHLTEESEKEKNDLLAENQRLKEAIAKNQDGSEETDSPPPYNETV